MKFNADMGVEWAQNFGGTGTDVLFDVDVLENGTIVAAGQSFLAEKVGNAVNASGWVLMIDPDDPSLFKEIFPGGSKGDYLQAVCAMEDNEFVIVRYGADGSFLNGEVVGTIDRTVDFTGITATSDGGYFAYGSADSELIEGFQKERGYTFGNAGAHDFLLIKYDAGNNCVWSESYGADAGDYINGMIVTDEGHLVGGGHRGIVRYSFLK